MVNMRRPFIVGGAGFVGATLVRRLRDAPGVDHVLVYDNLSTTGNWSHLLSYGNVRLIEGNARDLDYLRATMRDFVPDTVFHLAANPDIARAANEPTIDFEQGTVLTQNVLEAMRVNSVPNLVYFSGSGVYGYQGNVALPESFGPMRPISTYGASKLACEALICAYTHMFGLTARAFRFANIVGPRQTHGVGYDFLRKLKADPAKLVVLGDGTQSKSYIHVSDALNAVFQATDAMAPGSYDVFNVATHDWLSVREIAHMAVEVAGAVNAELIFGDSDRGWKGDVPVIRFDCDEIHRTGWRCMRNSREAMQAALEAMAEELG